MIAPSFVVSLPHRLARLSRRAKVVLGVFALGSAALIAAALPFAASALSIQQVVVDIVNTILLGVVTVLGQLLVALVQILIQIVQYNDFLKAPAVETGWVIIRDIGNMFFIVVLIMIAFGSILRIQGYRYNQWLFRIVLMALLVNFSKTIAGFFIDVAQVVTLTFVNAFKDTAAGNFADLFGITKILTLRETPTGTQFVGPGLDIVGSFLLAVLFLVIALVVTAVYVIIFLLRIIVLWFLVILSPMAYVLNTFKQGEPYAKQWWKYFGDYLVVGPLLAFFLWLALTLTSAGGATSTLEQQLTREAKLSEQFTDERVGFIADTADKTAGDVRVALSEIGSTPNILNFIAGIALLVGALGVASRLRFAGGQIATNVRTRIGRGLSRVGRNPYVQGTLGLATGGLVGGAAAAQALLRTGPARRVGQRVGYDLADATLGAVGRVPIIGAAARRARSRLAGTRFAAADKLERDVKYATPRELVRNSSMIPVDERAKQVRFKSNERLINQNLFKAAGVAAAAIPGVFQRYRADGQVQIVTERNKQIQVKQYDKEGNLRKDEKTGQPILKTIGYDARSESSRNPDVKETLKKGYETNPAASLSFEDYRRAEERDRAAAVEARVRPLVERIMQERGVDEKEARDLVPKEQVEIFRREEANKIQFTHRVFSGQSPRKIAEMSSDNATNEPLMRALATHVYTEMKKGQRAEFNRFAAPDILAAVEKFKPPKVEGEEEPDDEGGRRPTQPQPKEPQPRRRIFDAYGRPYEPGKEEPKEEEQKPEEKGQGREKPKEPERPGTQPPQPPPPGEPGQPPPSPRTAYLAGEPPYSTQQRDQVLTDLGKNVSSLSRAAEQIADAVGSLRSNAAQVAGDPQRLSASMERLLQEVSLQRQKSGSVAAQEVLTGVEREITDLRKAVTRPTSPFEAEALRKRLQDLTKSFQAPKAPPPPSAPSA